MKKEKRQSGIELLRIITMMGVIVLHYNDGRAFKYVTSGSINQYVLFFLESCCICAVDLFILISGYFLCSTNKRSVQKIAELIIQVIIINELLYILKVCLGSGSISYRGLIRNIIPTNYFVILYSAMYIVSPYVNLIFCHLDKKGWKKFMFTILLLFSVWPILTDLSGEILAVEWFGLSTIAAWGNQQGFNIVNFILLYTVGAYLRFCDKDSISWKKLMGLTAALIMGIFAWSVFNQYTTLHGLRSAWCYHNPLVILLSVVLFLQFKQMQFYKGWINELAKASFTCFLLHGKILPKFNIENAVGGNTMKMLCHILMVVVSLYLLSYIVYKVYFICTRWIFAGLSYVTDKINISFEMENKGK